MTPCVNNDDIDIDSGFNEENTLESIHQQLVIGQIRDMISVLIFFFKVKLLTYRRSFFSGGDFRSQPSHTTSPALLILMCVQRTFPDSKSLFQLGLHKVNYLSRQIKIQID